MVFHTNPFKTKGIVTAEVWLKEPQDFYITDCDGNKINAHIVHHGSQFTFKLPKDKFRIAIFDHKYTVKFPVTLSGVGYTVFKVNFGKAENTKTDLTVNDRGAENKYIRFSIEDDGTITLFDKISGKEYKGLNLIEDGIDWGNGYNYKGIENETRLYAVATEISLKEKNEFFATYQIKSVLDIPKGLDGEKSRSEETIEHVINTFVTITSDSRRLDFSLNLNNQSENHRLRALFTTNTSTPYVYADGQFDVIKREIQPLESWKNPCYNQRFQAFVSLEDETSGFMVASRGLNSYEVLRDGKNTVALTLLRSVGTIGDWTWGKMSNPLMQVKGEITLKYSVIPFAMDEKAEAYSEGYAFNSDCLFAYETDKHAGTLTTSKVFAELTGDFIRCTAIKKAENGKDIIMRLCNISEESRDLSMKLNDISLKGQTNLAEEKDAPFEESQINAKKIVTLKFE